MGGGHEPVLDLRICSSACVYVKFCACLSFLSQCYTRQCCGFMSVVETVYSVVCLRKKKSSACVSLPPLL